MDAETLRYWYLRRIVGSALAAIGPRRSLRLALALAHGVYDLNPPGRRTAEQRLQRAFGPALADAQRDAVVRTMYEHLARFWIEVLFLPRFLRPTTWRGRVALDAAGGLPCGAQNGCILATCYFGNIAVLAYALGQLLRPVHVLVDYLAHPAARAWQEQLYRVGHVRPLAVGDSLAELPRVLERGGKVLLVAEHRRARGAGVETSFLGDAGPFQPTAARLAAWYHLPAVPVLCRRLPGDFAFELWAGRPVRGDDPAAITADLLAQLDARVRRWPEQYLWSAVGPAQRLR